MSAPDTAPRRTEWTALIALAVGVFVVSLDMTLVAIALPVMRAELGASTTAIEWVVLGYTLPMVALCLPIGRLIDQIGARNRVFAIGVAGFGLASVAIGFAPSLELVVAGRIVQGAFGAAISSVIPALAMSVAAQGERGRAMSVISTVGPLGAVAGPAAGGHLLTIASWHWIFFVNIPITIGVLLMARGRFGAGVANPSPAGRRWLGDAALLVGATGALLYSLTETAEQQWVAALALAAGAAAGYLAWARMTADRRLIAMLRSRATNRGPVGLVLMCSFGSGVFLLTPFILMSDIGASSSAAGNTLLAMPLGMALVGPLGGLLADRFEPERVAFAGALIACLGGVLLSAIDASWSLTHVAAFLVIAGMGMGLFMGPNMAMSMAAAPPDGGGAVGAMTTLGRNLGFSLGPALATIVWHLSETTASGYLVGIATTATAGVLLVGAIRAPYRAAGAPEPRPAPQSA